MGCSSSVGSSQQKNETNASRIQQIMVGSIYSKPDSRKNSLLLDHIAQVYNLFSSRYRNGLHWILCGDTNGFKLDDILNLIPGFKQVSQNPTRLYPPRMIDPIITTLSDFHQEPECLPQLDPDPDNSGKPSDHLMVVMAPISVVNNRPVRVKKKITYRLFSDRQ